MMNLKCPLIYTYTCYGTQPVCVYAVFYKTHIEIYYGLVSQCTDKLCDIMQFTHSLSYTVFKIFTGRLNFAVTGSPSYV